MVLNDYFKPRGMDEKQTYSTKKILLLNLICSITVVYFVSEYFRIMLRDDILSLLNYFFNIDYVPIFSEYAITSKVFAFLKLTSLEGD